jgi:hypothetical protein
MPPTHPEFNDRTLDQLLVALRARTTDYPDNPGLIACWPGVREDRMSAACAELSRRGHPVFRVSIDGTNASPSREGWALAGATDKPLSDL